MIFFWQAISTGTTKIFWAANFFKSFKSVRNKRGRGGGGEGGRVINLWMEELK